MLRQPLPQAAQLRVQLMDEWVKPAVQTCFDRYPALHSATLLVAQYWDDEAINAVHNFFVFSVLETPDLDAAFWAEDHEPDSDPINLPGLPAPWELLEIVWQRNWQRPHQLSWEDNGNAIPAFAPFCSGGAHPGMSLAEAYSPYAIFRRAEPGGLKVERVGRKHRPWLEDQSLDWRLAGEDWPGIFRSSTDWLPSVLDLGRGEAAS